MADHPLARLFALTAANDLTPEEAAQVDAMRLEMASSIIRQWKINRPAP